MYTVSQAEALTGIPSTTLRAWERRYGIIAPRRTEGGYRLYDAAQIAMLREMAARVRGGMRPAQAAASLADYRPPEPARAAPLDAGTPAGTRVWLADDDGRPADGDVLATVAKLPFHGFVAGSDTGNTRALPVVWTAARKFKEMNDKMVDATGKLAVAAKSGSLDQLKASFGPAAQTCKACHDEFRKK